MLDVASHSGILSTNLTGDNNQEGLLKMSELLNYFSDGIKCFST